MLDEFCLGYEYPQVAVQYWYYRTQAKTQRSFVLPPHQLFPEPTCVPANNHKAFYSKIPDTHKWTIEMQDPDPSHNVTYAGREHYTTKPWKHFIILPFNLPTFKQLNSNGIRFPDEIMWFIYAASRVDPYALEYKKEPHPKKQPNVYNYIDNITKMQRELQASSKLANDESRIWIYNYTLTPLNLDTITTKPNWHRITLLEVSDYTWTHLNSQPIPVPDNIPETFRDPQIFQALTTILKPAERFKFSWYNKWNDESKRYYDKKLCRWIVAA